MGLDPSLRSEPHEHETLKADETDAIMCDVDPEPEQIQDHPKDQGEEMTKVNLAEKGKVDSLPSSVPVSHPRSY